jgi:hypothetical protein
LLCRLGGAEPGRTTLVSDQERGTNVKYATGKDRMGLDRLANSHMVDPLRKLAGGITFYRGNVSENQFVDSGVLPPYSQQYRKEI